MGTMDDDETMVGTTPGWPWTCYILVEAENRQAVVDACNLFRTTPVGDGESKLWKYCKIEARVGRELIIQ